MEWEKEDDKWMTRAKTLIDDMRRIETLEEELNEQDQNLAVGINNGGILVNLFDKGVNWSWWQYHLTHIFAS